MKINNIFVSIQGEGELAGWPAFFVRTQGCPLECSFCDTPEAQDCDSGTEYPIDDIAHRIKNLKRQYPSIDNIVITGGEPLYGKNGQVLPELINSFQMMGLHCHIETSGSIFPKNLFEGLNPDLLSITISPKINKEIGGYLPVSNAFFEQKQLPFIPIILKFLVGDYVYWTDYIDNFLTAINLGNTKIYLQPIDYGGEQTRTNNSRIMAMRISKSRNWPISCQIHKFLNIK